MEKTSEKTIVIARLGVMAALSVVLAALFHFPLFPAASFLEYDPADIPILLFDLWSRCRCSAYCYRKCDPGSYGQRFRRFYRYTDAFSRDILFLCRSIHSIPEKQDYEEYGYWSYSWGCRDGGGHVCMQSDLYSAIYACSCVSRCRYDLADHTPVQPAQGVHQCCSSVLVVPSAEECF